jgi:nucleotide-binding universal stress UspA family protein
MKTKGPTLRHSPAPVTATPESSDVIDLMPLMLHLSNILVPLDLSEMSLKALRYAVPFAQQFGAKLTLLHVAEMSTYIPELPYPPPLPPHQTSELKKELKKICEAYVPSEVQTQLLVRHDFAPDAIVALARKSKVDLIIVSTHGRTGLKHVFLGSVAEKIVRHAPCPVLVVREKEHDFV